MKLVAGLGNPGRKYAGTRHNIGFDVADALARRHGAEWEAAPRGIEALVARWRGASAGSVGAGFSRPGVDPVGAGFSRPEVDPVGAGFSRPEVDSVGAGFSRPEVDPVGAGFSRPEVVLAKPLTFMNLSGTAIVALLQFYKIDPLDLLVLVDDVNIELGRLRARMRGSAGGHNGLKSIIGSLGSEEFARLRIGVGRGDDRRDLADHVLAKFDAAERAIVSETVGRAADAVELFVAEGMAPVMNRYNRGEDAARGEGAPASDRAGEGRGSAEGSAPIREEDGK